ncbi:MAG: hypothetical protein EPO51_06720 [Phenylobacterium sp.]|uniref:hypothetical protein n=1 Tax=Phenylobacterium sp. TaxID=1871053 RepID=UPI001222C39C|nr:hypothetical protein [Phenylobacterium sp.]TAJ73323.1 MAG: hypothetical protein EPO51_06720 [Phenylobacterium sp.]
MIPDYDQQLLSPVTDQVVVFVKRHASGPIIEIGAGDGRWVRALRDAGLTIRGFDPWSSGDGVETGDHLEAAKADGTTLLAIWPPDGPLVQAWIGSKVWDRIILGYQRGRLNFDHALDSYEMVDDLLEGGGKKGPYRIQAWRRVPS